MFISDRSFLKAAHCEHNKTFDFGHSVYIAALDFIKQINQTNNYQTMIKN